MHRLKKMSEVLDVNNRRIYLDYNATTPLDGEVADDISRSLTSTWANPSSGYGPGKLAKEAIENARRQVADMLSASSKDIIFTSGGTEANNLVIHTALEHFRRTVKSKSDGCTTPPATVAHVVTTAIEHDAIKLPLEHFERRGELEVTVLQVSKVSGCVEVDDVVAALRPNTCLVTIMLANNETGVIQPVREIVNTLRARLKENGANFLSDRVLFHTDAAQAIGKISVDVRDLNVDYLTVVGHKFYGPRIGALYVRDLGTECPLYPQFFGGGQERSYRPGTENTPMIVGLGKAAELVTKNLISYTQHFNSRKTYLMQRLMDSFGERAHINSRFGDTLILPNTVNVSILGDNFQGYKVLANCTCLMASVGAACHAQGGPSAILLASGIQKGIAANALRLSIGRETTDSDIDVVVADLMQSIDTLEKIETITI